MAPRTVKLLLVATFSLFAFVFSSSLLARNSPHQEATGEHAAKEGEKEEFNAAEVIFGHILDNHEFHFTEFHDSEGKLHHVSLPLPIILYSKERGLTAFMSSKFEHGEATHNGYKI